MCLPSITWDIYRTIALNHQNTETGGLTMLENLNCLCRQHHQLKTYHGGLHYTELAYGTVV